MPAGLALALLAGLLAWLVTTPGHRAYDPTASIPRIRSGTVAPAFDLPRLGGGARVTLASYRGHPVVINFFASWCNGCRAELGAFARVSNGAHGAVRFVGIDTGDTNPAGARRLLRAAGDAYPVGIDSGAAADAYVVPTLPTTIFVRADGTVAGVSIGAEDVASLQSAVRKLGG